MAHPILYGFNGSTYVRTVRMLLDEKAVDYEQVPVDVLAGEAKQPEHIARHPFGKVPVLDHDELRLLETSAITRYVNDAFDGPSFIPKTVKERARMDSAIGMIDAYGYGALLGQVTAYHLFPDFVGGKNDEARKAGIRDGMTLLTWLMEMRGTDGFLAGAERSLADFYLAPLCAYVGMTDDAEQIFQVAGFANWWEQVQALPSFQKTAP